MKIFVLLATLIPWTALSAQVSYESLLEGDRCWTMQYKSVLSPERDGVMSFEEVRLNGDTVIGGILFKQKISRSWLHGCEKPTDWTASHEYLGQEGGKVYLFSNIPYYEMTEPRLIMDFSANAGDIIEVGLQSIRFSYAVTSSDYAVLQDCDDHTPRRCLYVRSTEGGVTDKWIEGIGSAQFGISSTIPSDGTMVCLYSCSNNGIVTYKTDGDVPSGIRTVGASNKLVKDIFDLQGRRVIAQPCRGLYVRDGRKYVAR